MAATLPRKFQSIHLFHVFSRSVTYSFIYSLTHSLISSNEVKSDPIPCIHSSIRTLIDSLTHSFTHSLTASSEGGSEPIPESPMQVAAEIDADQRLQLEHMLR